MPKPTTIVARHIKGSQSHITREWYALKHSSMQSETLHAVQYSCVSLRLPCFLYNLHLCWGPLFQALAGMRAILCMLKPPCRWSSGSHRCHGSNGTYTV